LGQVRAARAYCAWEINQSCGKRIQGIPKLKNTKQYRTLSRTAKRVSRAFEGMLPERTPGPSSSRIAHQGKRSKKQK
jgi:ribosomal protein L34E